MVFTNIEGILLADSLKVKIIGKPSHSCQDSSRDGSESEEDELRVMLCAFADPTVGEGWLVAVDLRDLVDDEESGDYDQGAELEEERCREGTFKHVDFYSIIMGIQSPAFLGDYGQTWETWVLGIMKEGSLIFSAINQLPLSHFPQLVS